MSKVKICGLSRIEDIEAVNHSMPDYAGFVFAESRRRVEEEKAAVLRKHLDPGIEAVGVFVNEDADKIATLYNDSVIDIAQLHGDEDSDYIKRLKEGCGCRVIKAVAVGKVMPPIPKGPDHILFDTLSEERGGTGRMFDWHIIKGFDRTPYFLAGGLDPGNVQEAVRFLSPYCVDVSGGVETHGVKDPAKIDEFVSLVRRVENG